MDCGHKKYSANAAEGPAIECLTRMGYRCIASDAIETERAGPRDAILTRRLAACLKKLNPWLSDDSLHEAVRAITSIEGTSLIEVNEELYTSLTYGISLEQNGGEG